MDGARVIPMRGRRTGGRASGGLPSGGQAGGLGRTPARVGASIHPLPAAAAGPGTPKSGAADREDRLRDGLAFLRRRLAGDYRVDDFGFDPELTENVVLPLLKPLYDRWFRVEVDGVEHIPAEGPALLVANHAGGLWPLDAAMTAVAVHENTAGADSPGRHLRMLGAGLLFTAPGLGALARKSGATLACHPDAERLLDAGELLGAWPEGFQGLGKVYRERYQLQRFGHDGFVAAAIKAGAPIIPVSIVGSEDIHPVLANARTLARIVKLPYFPLTPTFPWLGPFGLLPLPSKWYIEFGEAIPTGRPGARSASDPRVVFDLTDLVRETIQSTLHRLLGQRRSVWR